MLILCVKHRVMFFLVKLFLMLSKLSSILLVRPELLKQYKDYCDQFHLADIPTSVVNQIDLVETIVKDSNVKVVVAHNNILNDDFTLFQQVKVVNPGIINILLVDKANNLIEDKIIQGFKQNLIDLYLTLPASNLEMISHVKQISQLISGLSNNSAEQHNVKQRLPVQYVIEALSCALDAKCGYTAGHSLRVGKLAIFIGKSLNLLDADLFYLGLGGVLHDIGKIGVPESILWKESALDITEKQIMNLHPVTSAHIVENLKMLDKVKDYVLYHHEFVDGSGYPANLLDEEIPLGSKIILVADAYDAMTSDRPYRKAIGHNLAVAELNKFKGKQFDIKIVDCFLSAMSKIPDFNVDDLPLDLFEN